MKMAALSIMLFLEYALMLLYAYSQQVEFQTSWNGMNLNVSNCNTSDVPFQLKSLNFFPHPVKLGGGSFMNTSFELSKDVGRYGKMIGVDLNLRLKTDKGYTELCELIGEDVCYHQDLCGQLRKFMQHKGNICPSFMKEKYHNNCSCPFDKNHYEIPTVPLYIPPLPFEIFGTFDVTLKLHEEGIHIGCVNVQFCITDCLPLGAR